MNNINVILHNLDHTEHEESTSSQSESQPESDSCAIQHCMTDLDLSTSQDISAMDHSHSQSLYQSLESDIGKLMELNTDFRKLDREVRYCILTQEPNPDPRAYPRKRLHEGQAKRQFQPSWLKSYPWLHYSDYVDGAFCRACVFFAPDKVGGQPPGSFVTKPFKKWNRMSEKANLHSEQEYHKVSMTKVNEFCSQYKNPSQSISTILNTETQRIMTENIKVIESLFKIFSNFVW